MEGVVATGDRTVINIHPTNPPEDTDGGVRETEIEPAPQEPHVSTSTEILRAVVEGDQEASTYLAEKISTGFLVFDWTTLIAAVLVILVEATTHSLSLSSGAWVFVVLTGLCSLTSIYATDQWKKLVSLTHQVDRLGKQVTKLSTAIDDELGPQVTHLTADNKRFDDENKRLDGENARLKRTNEQLDGDVKRLDGDAKDFAAKNTQYQALLREHQALQTEMHATLEGMTKKYGALTVDAEATLDKDADEMNRLKIYFDAVMPKCTGLFDSLQGDLDKLNLSLVGLQKACTLLAGLQGEADKVASVFANMTQAGLALTAKEEAVAAKLAELQRMQEELLGREEALEKREAALVDELEKDTRRLTALVHTGKDESPA